jgi:hypothetical protein
MFNALALAHNPPKAVQDDAEQYHYVAGWPPVLLFLRPLPGWVPFPSASSNFPAPRSAALRSPSACSLRRFSQYAVYASYWGVKSSCFRINTRSRTESPGGSTPGIHRQAPLIQPGGSFGIPRLFLGCGEAAVTAQPV